MLAHEEAGTYESPSKRRIIVQWRASWQPLSLRNGMVPDHQWPRSVMENRYGITKGIPFPEAKREVLRLRSLVSDVHEGEKNGSATLLIPCMTIGRNKNGNVA